MLTLFSLCYSISCIFIYIAQLYIPLLSFFSYYLVITFLLCLPLYKGKWLVLQLISHLDSLLICHVFNNCIRKTVQSNFEQKHHVSTMIALTLYHACIGSMENAVISCEMANVWTLKSRERYVEESAAIQNGFLGDKVLCRFPLQCIYNLHMCEV